MTRTLGSVIASAPPRAALAKSNHHGKVVKKTKALAPKKYVGTLQLFLRGGTVLSAGTTPLAPAAYPDACLPVNGHAQRYRLTLTLLGGRFTKKQILSSGQQIFKDIPTGRYRIDAVNVSAIPCYADAVAEVVVKRGTNPPFYVIHSNDSLLAIGNACGFKLGAFDTGGYYSSALATEVNEITLATFWNEFWVGEAVVPPGQSSAVVPAAPPLTGNMVVLDKATRRPIPWGSGVVVGVPGQSSASPPQPILSFFAPDALGNLQPVDPAVIGGKTVRFRPPTVRPAVPLVSYTPFVWRAPVAMPPGWDAKHPTTGAALEKLISEHVEESIAFLPLQPKDQCVVVNESLDGDLTWNNLLGSREKKGGLATRFRKADVARNPQKLIRWLATHEKDRDAFFARCLTQNQTHSWLASLKDSGPRYIQRSFESAFDANKDGRYLLNDFGIEDLARPKSIAFVVLAEHLKRSLSGGAGGRLAAGFQMHLTPTSAPYQPPKKWQAFTQGLGAVIRQLGRLGLTVHVTEMAARMPSVDAFDLRRTRGDFHQAVINAQSSLSLGTVQEQEQLLIALGGHPVHGQSVTETTQKLLDHIVAHFKVWADTRAKAAIREAKKRLPGLSKSESIAAQNSLFTHLLKAFPNNPQWANVRKWQGNAGPAGAPGVYPPTATYIQDTKPVPVPGAKTQRTQKEVFRDVVQKCLSQWNCNDVNFWGLVDNPLSDDSTDLMGHLFDQHVGGPPASSTPWFRKPAFYGVLTGAIEAAVVKGKLPSYARCQNRTPQTIGKE